MIQTIIVIPSLEPDQKLLSLLESIRQKNQTISILIIDDGSGDLYEDIFQEAVENYHTEVIHHPNNLGKGAALKTAIRSIVDKYPDIERMVTIDSDGQHTYEDMDKTIQTACNHPNSIVLGVRQFNKETVPFRSRFGNYLTSFIMRVSTGLDIEDTQTGLRVIPRHLFEEMLKIEGNRYEYETNMLIASQEKKWPIVTVPIATIYIEENKSSHFRVLTDSFLIYRVFIKFLLSSGLSFLIDIIAYAIIMYLLQGLDLSSIMIASFIARAISSLFNYLMNRYLVFNQQSSNSLLKYYLLVICQIVLSSLLVYSIHQLFMLDDVVAVKILVDSILFILSYFVQKKLIFKEGH